MNIIVAMSENRVIGGPDGQPWDIPEEKRQLFGLVEGQVVILGRRGFELGGQDLPSFRTLVLSRSVTELPGATVVPTLEAALREAWGTGRKIFCAGGASLFEQTLPLADKLYLSTVHGTFEGAYHFPSIEADEWTEERCRQHQRFEFRVYRRSG